MVLSEQKSCCTRSRNLNGFAWILSHPIRAWSCSIPTGTERRWSVRRDGLFFLGFGLASDNFLLEVSPEQRIDQIDLGLLIRNIAHSLTDPRSGQVEVEREDGYIRLRVLADDHFREGIVTGYQFVVDRELWLPVKVQE